MTATAWLLKSDEGVCGTLTPLGMALFLGRPVEEIEPYFDRREEFPADWWMSGKRRGREAAAQLGSEYYDMSEILGFWADKDLAADVLQVENGLLLVDR